MKNRIAIEKPCTANWNTMDGDARRRMCGQCNKHVHNLSAMREAEADKVVEQAADRICVRYRADRSGRIVHRPSRTSRLVRFAVAAVGVVAAVPALASGKVESGGAWSWIAEVVESLTAEVEHYDIMGEMAMVVDPHAVTNRTGQALTLTCTDGSSQVAAPDERIQIETWEGAVCSVLVGTTSVELTAAEVVCKLDSNGLVCE